MKFLATAPLDPKQVVFSDYGALAILEAVAQAVRRASRRGS